MPLIGTAIFCMCIEELLYILRTLIIFQHSNMEFQVIPRTNDLVVRRELDGWSDLAWKKTYSHVPTRKIQDIVPSSRDTGSSERGNSVVPVRLGVMMWTILLSLR